LSSYSYGQTLVSTQEEAVVLAENGADSLRSNPTYSVQELLKAIAWFDQNPNSEDAAKAYNWLGYAYTYINKIDSAEFYFQKSTIAQLNLQHYDKALESEKDLIAGTLVPAGKFQKALNLALKIKEKTKNATDKELIYITNEIFIRIYWDLDDFREELLELAIETEEIAYELGDSSLMENAGFYVASAYGKNGKTMLSINEYKKIIEIQLARGDNHVSAAYNNVGTQFLALELYDSAIYYLEKGEYYSTLENRLDGVAASKLKIGFAYGNMGQLEKSLKLCTEALNMLKDANIIRRQNSCVECIYISLEGLGKKGEAYDWLLLHKELEDSLLSSAEEKELRAMQNTFNQEIESLTDSLNFEYEQNLNETQIESQNKRSVLLYIGLALSILFGGFILNRFRITRKQKAIIEEQKGEVARQHNELLETHKEITDSISYAERIQYSFLASRTMLDQNLNEYFVFFQPKDVVSGDFYWAGKLNNGNFAIVNADSTGHGVPGAIMSILNISSIESAVKDKLTKPADIFNDTRRTIIERLKKDGSEEGGKDGMDASLISFNSDKTKMTYVAAQNPIWIIRDGELTDIKPEKMPIGKHDKDHIPFVGGEFETHKGDQIYTLTDGFQDQFGGPDGKKYMVKKMREYIVSISQLSMEEQHQKINEVFTEWKGELEQVDDVCVIGVKV